ncbi:MAG: hypothetical protein HKO76_06110 [Acidimicrobiia bacterium]|nr:hypothetical protein [Acidimicrobiia bacterium]
MVERKKIRNIDTFVKSGVQSLRELAKADKNVGDARHVTDEKRIYIFSGKEWEPYLEYLKWLKSDGFTGR